MTINIKYIIIHFYVKYKNVLLYIAGSFFVQGLSFFALPIFSKILDPIDFGYYASYNFWISIMYVFVGIQIHSTINNAFIDFGENRIYKYTSSICVVGILTFLIFLFLTLILKNSFCNFFELNVGILIIGIIQALFMFFLMSITSIYRVQNKPLKYLIFSISNAFLDICLSIIIILFLSNKKYLGRVYASLISAIVIGGIACFFIYKNGKTLYDKKFIKYGLKIAIPLIGHSLAGIVISRIDQLMLLKMIGASKSGVYSFGNNFGHIIYVLYTSCNYVFIPWYFKALSLKKISTICAMVKKYIYVFKLICSMIILILPEIIKFMSTDKYYDAIYFAPLLAASFFICFLYTFLVNYEFYHKKTIYIALGTIMTMIINIILNATLIPKYCEIGAAVATLISYITLLVFHYLISRRVIGGYQIEGSIFLNSIIFIFGVLVVFYLTLKMLLLRWILAMLILVYFVVYIICKKIKLQKF